MPNRLNYAEPSRTQINYHNANLSFDENGDIKWHNPEANETWEVMMTWEIPIMEKMAEVCVNEGDHVLECGFGMGILSTAVQARKPASHTITETHPQIQPKLAEFAANHPTVIPVNDRWLSLIDNPGRYDVILMDTYADADLHPKFAYFVKSKGKHGGKASWWNFSGGKTSEYMKFYWPDEHIVFHDVNINPPQNQYYNRSVYHVPVYTIQQPATGYGIVEGDVSLPNNKTRIISKVGAATQVLSCADPVEGSIVTQSTTETFSMLAKGIYNINNGLIKATGTMPMVVKRSGNWIEQPMGSVVVGDKLYKIDNTEVEITSIDFDSSDTEYRVYKIDTEHNYFVNDILIQEGGSSA